jgi:hypothetical protein
MIYGMITSGDNMGHLMSSSERIKANVILSILYCILCSTASPSTILWDDNSHVFVPCYHLLLSLILSLHPLLWSQVIIITYHPLVWCYHPMVTLYAILLCNHPMLSSQVITLCLHPMLSSHVIIPCYHPLLSSHAIITFYHLMLSYHFIIPCYHPKLSPYAIIQLCHPTLSSKFMIPGDTFFLYYYSRKTWVTLLAATGDSEIAFFSNIIRQNW